MLVVEGASGGNFFTGDPGKYVRKVSGYGHLSPYGLLYDRGEPGIWRGLIYWGL